MAAPDEDDVEHVWVKCNERQCMYKVFSYLYPQEAPPHTHGILLTTTAPTQGKECKSTGTIRSKYTCYGCDPNGGSICEGCRKAIGNTVDHPDTPDKRKSL